MLGSQAEPAPITAIVLTFNEALNIEDCLRSIDGLCEQIFIVDSGSTDQTIEICRRYTDNVVCHPFVNSRDQWQWALTTLPIRTPWVMPLDADHRVTPGLRAQLWSAARTHGSVALYYSRHEVYFRGTRVRGFKPYGVRLMIRDRVSMDPSELVDFRFITPGETAILSGTLEERNAKEEAIDFWVDKHQVFSTRQAIEEVLRRRGIVSWTVEPRLFGNPDQRIVWLKNVWYRLPLFVRPWIYVVYRLLMRGGLLDGASGIAFHTLQAFWFRLIVDLKIQSLEEQLRRGEITEQDLTQGNAWRELRL